MYRLFILAKCDLGHAEVCGEAITELDDVREVYSITGEHDLLIKALFEDLNDIGDFVQDHLHRIPHLKEAVTMASFRVYGQDMADFVNRCWNCGPIANVAIRICRRTVPARGYAPLNVHFVRTAWRVRLPGYARIVGAILLNDRSAPPPR